VQFRETIGVVGVDRGTALDQRTLAAHRRIGAGPSQDAFDEVAGLLMPFARRQRPGGRQQQARPTVDLVGRHARQPVQHGALAPAGHQRLVQAAFGQVVSDLALTSRQRMAGRRFQQAHRGQGLDRARMQPGLLVGRQQPEAALQLAARQRMHAQPVAPFDGGEDRRVACQSLQALRRPLVLPHEAAEIRMQGVEDGNPRHECHVGGVEVGQQQIHELVAQCAALRFHHRDLGLRVAARGHHR